ncbi:UPF0481 protein [Camellia lanceoleosa]|uniref:UPF0481 protein n=1 Tax=Camellia lanceoleosa TaxID=1840588 RepID=A0ACC0GEL7_9ERIC|nr:UPF0481 protein [Camellia lanceoleosa]
MGGNGNGKRKKRREKFNRVNLFERVREPYDEEYNVSPFGRNIEQCDETEYPVNPFLTKTEQHDEWIVLIKEMLEEVKRPSKLSIYKVPNKLVKIKEDAYTPNIVSIGPFHHHNKELLAFEEHKRRYMVHLLARTLEAEEANRDECANAILGLVEEARRCYSEYIDLDKHKLAMILLVDGCFILELFLRYSVIENQEEKEEEDVVNDDPVVPRGSSIDPIINDSRIVATLQHDLALLENQIPFFVLQTLFDLINKSVTLPHTLTKYALLFFQSALGFSDESVASKSLDVTGDHLLHILHNFHVPKTLHKGLKTLHKNHEDDPHGLQIYGFTDCATQLLKAGIQLHGNTEAIAEENFFAIEFHDGVVKMSSLRIHEATESIFRNLIAFEQCNIIGSSHCIASYAFLMRSILRSSHDVDLLKEKKIIKDLNGGDSVAAGSGGGGGEDLAIFFKSLCEGVVLKDFYFSGLCEEVLFPKFDCSIIFRRNCYSR